MCLTWHKIREHLTASTSTFGFQRSFDLLRRSQSALKPFGDPAALLNGLHRPDGDPGQKNMILIALIRAAQSDGPCADHALTLLLLALWPGLDGIRRRSLARRMGTAEDIASDLLARGTEAIRTIHLGRVNWIAATVLRNVERDMIRVRRRDEAREHLTSAADPDEVADSGDSGIGAAGYGRLEDAMRAVLGDDAVIVIRVAVEGFTQAEAAVELGLTRDAARKRYQRAVRRLREALQEKL
jgi:RNA polymerase sigma-70 factor (ECF subfamily)